MESIYNKGNNQSLLLIAKNFFVAHERTFVDTPVFWKDGETESTNLKKDSGVNFGQTGFLVDWRTKVRLFPVQDVLGFSLSATQWISEDIFSIFILPYDIIEILLIATTHKFSFRNDFTPLHRDAFCQFLFRGIYYGSNKSTGKKLANRTSVDCTLMRFFYL